MRFERLDILRYGALTDRAIDFRSGARLHVIYGPNEAGKSSALKAISDLLFGFPTVAENSFLHDPASLRVGARIMSRDGAPIEFRRRRGRKNTLLAASNAEEPLADDALAPFLGTLSREIFQRAFGLDSESLRAGGAAMLKSGGEIGQLLFSAASGLNGLSVLRKQLEGEADGIYAPRRSKDRLFYQALDAHDEARQVERQSELKASDWKNLLAKQADLDSQQSDMESDRQQTRRRLEELRRLVRLAPIVRELDRLRLQQQPLAALSVVTRGFDERLAASIARLQDLYRQHEAARLDAVRLVEERQQATVDTAILAQATRILAAYAQTGAYVNAREDIAHVRRELDGFDQRLDQAARRLGFASYEQLSSAQPTDADLARLKSVVESGVSLDRDVKQNRQQIEHARETLRHLQSESGSLRLVDPRTWADRLAALRPDLADLAALDGLHVKVTRAESDLEAAISRLDPPVRDVAALLAAPLPDLATLATHRTVIDAAKAEQVKAAAKVADLQAEMATIGHQIQALEGSVAIVSREEIAKARERRDGLLDDLGGKSDGAGRLEFDVALREADRLADAALADAERVSRFAQLKLRQGEVREAIDAAGRAVRDKEIAASDAITDFEDLFRSCPVKPTSAMQMIEWRRSAQDVAALAAALEDARDAFAIVQAKQERVSPLLVELAEALDIDHAGVPSVVLARSVERRIEEHSTNWSQTRAAEGKRRAAEESLEVLENEERRLRGAADDWRVVFSHAAGFVGLPEDASTEMATAALDVWRTVPDLASERENRARRVRGMARDMDAFETELSSLRGLLQAGDLTALPADLAAEALSKRLAEARAADGHYTALSSALQRAQATETRLAEEIRADEAALAALTVSVSPEVGSDLPLAQALLADVQRKLAFDEELARLNVRLAEEAGEMDEATVRTVLGGFDGVAAALEVEKLEAEQGRQFERMKALGSAQAESDRQRRELETGVGAERAVLLKLAAEQEARDLARQWVVLKLAAGLLATSLETYREKQADPVMRRAGAVFSELTGGRFSRLVQVYDDADELRLVAERANGERVNLEGLSEGTGDQLYLALRLAFLDDYATHNEPAPLVLDDIFQTFDDQRTAAGLRTLGGYGERFQTVLFTHQESLVDIARSELGDQVDIIRI